MAVYDTDAATWKALSQAFEPMSGDTATWVRITDAATGIAVTFFKSHDDDAEWDAGAPSSDPEWETERAANESEHTV